MTKTIRKKAKNLYVKAADNAVLRTSLQILIGPLDTLVFDNANKIKEQRVSCFLNRLSKDLKELKKEVNANKAYFKSEEFLFLFEDIMSNVAKENFKEKITLFKNLFVGIAIKNNHGGYDYKDHLHTLNSMTPQQIIIFFYLVKVGINNRCFIEIEKRFDISKKVINSQLQKLAGLGLLTTYVESNFESEEVKIGKVEGEVESEIYYQISNFGNEFYVFLKFSSLEL